jgi:hypothetical protein
MAVLNRSHSWNPNLLKRNNSWNSNFERRCSNVATAGTQKHLTAAVATDRNQISNDGAQLQPQLKIKL